MKEPGRRLVSLVNRRPPEAAIDGKARDLPAKISPFLSRNGEDHFPYFVSSFNQRAASRFTLAGAVPPRLTREATEFSTESTL